MTEPRVLVLLRHGQTSWNAEQRIQGQLDSSLDDVGRAQSKAAAAVIARHRPAVVWSSDLRRARETAEYVAEAAGVEVRTDPRLREYHLGAFEGRTYAEVAGSDPGAVERFRAGDFSVPDGESAEVVGERMGAVIGELLAATPPGRTAVAVSHGAAIRAGIAAALGWGPELGHTLDTLRNCSWAVLAQRHDGGALRLRSYNRDAPPDFVPPGPVG